MPAFEWVHVQLHQQKGMISLSPPTICNSADPCTAPCRRRTARPPMPDDAWRPKPCARSPARTEMPRLRCCPRLPGDAHRGNG
ncbi:hypothetical protein AB32_0320 [Escherichia coli 2-316-03_S1_C2]|nr:hypothetical protein AC12_0344 [Escherichia coli 2-005-03_S3_C2]KEJ22215.1 hypothetical protein AB03_4331 [Escherichia coli 2-316-03_S1_C1]KEJ33907.1 hypothetical protein AB32_0320 [Escherichia coli 2-316-03_S1_C2]